MKKRVLHFLLQLFAKRKRVSLFFPINTRTNYSDFEFPLDFYYYYSLLLSKTKPDYDKATTVSNTAKRQRATLDGYPLRFV